MRRNFIAGLMVGLVLGALLGCWTEHEAWAQATAGPKMVVTKQSHDFKEVLEGTVIEHAFTIVNHGRETLLIEEVQAG